MKVGSAGSKPVLLDIDFPRRLIGLRESLGLTQSQLAKRCGLAISTINEIERGLRRNLTISTLLALCQAAEGLTPNDLLGFPPPPKPIHCPRCGSNVPHTPGECVLNMSRDGATNGKIAVLFGFTILGVTVLLRESYRILRLRKPVSSLRKIVPLDK